MLSIMRERIPAGMSPYVPFVSFVSRLMGSTHASINECAISH